MTFKQQTTIGYLLAWWRWRQQRPRFRTGATWKLSYARWFGQRPIPPWAQREK